jgi:hypothetical protein
MRILFLFDSRLPPPDRTFPSG